MTREIDERLLTRIWTGQWIEPSRLKSVEGRSLQVVFPGRPNGDAGPDFLEAIIAVEDGRLLKGDVELHVRATDWLVHGHHRNPAYNGVALHVTWSADSLWTEREDGARIDILSLKHCASLPIEALMEGPAPEPPFYNGCRQVADALGPEQVGEALDRAGDARFMARAAYHEGDLAWGASTSTRQYTSEALYRGLMRALGYSVNQEPFQRLAERLPYATLEGLAGGQPLSRRPEVIAASLLGVAGLLSSQTGDPSVGCREVDMRRLEGVWRGFHLAREMDSDEWHTFRTRPANHPRSRIIGAAHLLARFLDTGLVEGIEKLIVDGAGGPGPGLIETALVVPRHLGTERVREMVVNVVLPFARALGEHRSSPYLGEASLSLYRAVGRGRGNRATRQMAAQLFTDEGRRVINSGRRQQGLIHLFKGDCRHGYCAGCPLGRQVALNGKAAADRLRPGGSATTVLG